LSKPSIHDQEFIKYLETLVSSRDRGAIAALRRGLGKPPGMVHQMDRYVLRFLSQNFKRGDDEPYYLVAALFAFWHQGLDTLQNFDGNLGKSLLLLAKGQAEKPGLKFEEAQKRIEKRLVALLNSHTDDLPDRLRQIVSLLKSSGIPINWAQLLCDIRGWNHESRYVQRSWAREFWATLLEPEDSPKEDLAMAAVEADDD